MVLEEVVTVGLCSCARHAIRNICANYGTLGLQQVLKLQTFRQMAPGVLWINLNPNLGDGRAAYKKSMKRLS
jgi:hypothetical protein